MNKLNILQWNIRNFTKNKHALSKIVSNTNSHLICLQETWLTNTIKVNFSGYNYITGKNRELTRGGGVAILAKNGIAARPLTITTRLEACAAIAYLDPNPVTILSIYLPPAIPNIDINTELINLMQQLSHPIIICADINGHHPQWGSNDINSRGQIIFDFTQNHNLITLNNNCPTYETTVGTYTHIDVTVCSMTLATKLTWSTLPDNYTSDHFPIVIRSNLHNIRNLEKEPKYKLQEADWKFF